MATAFQVVSVLDAGSDVLAVTATLADGSEVIATGWVSATTNYYPPADYLPDGNLVAGATPRAMTVAEVGEYARSLVAAVLPPDPTPIAFS